MIILSEALGGAPRVIGSWCAGQRVNKAVSHGMVSTALKAAVHPGELQRQEALQCFNANAFQRKHDVKK